MPSFCLRCCRAWLFAVLAAIAMPSRADLPELLLELGRDPAAVLAKAKAGQTRAQTPEQQAEWHLLASEANTLLVLSADAIAEAEAGLAVLGEATSAKPLWQRLQLARAAALDLAGQSGKALPAINQVLEQLAASNDNQLKAEALHCRGVIYLSLQDMPAALADLQQAYGLAGTDDPRLARGDIAGSIANFYAWQNNIENAVRYYREAIEHFQRLEADVKLSISVYGLGTLYRDQGNWPEARRYFGWSLELSRKRHDDQGVAYAQQQLANVAINTGQLAQAQALLDLAQPLFERAADHAMAINNLISRSDLALARKQYPDALNWLSQAETRAKAQQLSWVEPRIWERRAELYAEQKNYQQAYEAYRTFNQQMNAAMKQESDQRVQELRIRFDSERREQQNELLQQQNALQEAALAQQRQRLWLYIAVALLSLLSTLFLLYAIHKGKQIRQKLDALAHTDELTGLPNRRCLMQEAQLELDRARRYRLPLCLAALDLDQFKSINDRFGHSAGDEVLQKFAALCRHNLRQTDLIGRVGGEEFVLVLPHTSLLIAGPILERLREDFKAVAIPALAGKHQPSISIGVTALTEADVSLADLLRRADEALYAAKQAGRDRVIVREPVESAAVGSRLGEGFQQYEKY